MKDGDIYDADYFLHGKESGKSLYTDYRWMPELTIPMAQTIVNHCGISKEHHILDFGCARGYTVKALRELGYNASGVDISQWAIDNADEETKPFLKCASVSYPIATPLSYDWIIAKDVLEHVRYIKTAIMDILAMARVGVFVVVPLSLWDGHGAYVVPEYDKDITHTQRLTLGGWARLFMKVGWKVEAAYRVPGVKDNYYKKGWEMGNGFLTCRRIEE